MPANRVVESAYLGPFASYDAFNSSTLFKPGELGIRVATVSGKEYQLVQLDSGATSATPAGAVVVGDSLYWTNKSTYTVTNDSRFAIGGQTTHGFRNEVAGIVNVAGTAGSYVFVQQKGRCAAVTIASASPALGDQIIEDTSTTGSQALVVAAATAPVCVPLGVVAATGTTVTTIACDLNVPGIP